MIRQLKHFSGMLDAQPRTPERLVQQAGIGGQSQVVILQHAALEAERLGMVITVWLPQKQHVLRTQ